jgi:hypothetical protein
MSFRKLRRDPNQSLISAILPHLPLVLDHLVSPRVSNYHAPVRSFSSSSERIIKGRLSSGTGAGRARGERVSGFRKCRARRLGVDDVPVTQATASSDRCPSVSSGTRKDQEPFRSHCSCLPEQGNHERARARPSIFSCAPRLAPAPRRVNSRREAVVHRARAERRNHTAHSARRLPHLE